MLKALVFLIVPYVSSGRWVHFSRAVLICQPHQHLFTHQNFSFLKVAYVLFKMQKKGGGEKKAPLKCQKNKKQGINVPFDCLGFLLTHLLLHHKISGCIPLQGHQDLHTSVQDRKNYQEKAERWPWWRKFACWDLNPRPFNHESGALTTELCLNSWIHSLAALIFLMIKKTPKVWIQTQKGSKERLFIMTRTRNMQIFREIPFVKPQNDT